MKKKAQCFEFETHGKIGAYFFVKLIWFKGYLVCGLLLIGIMDVLVYCFWTFGEELKLISCNY